MLWLPQERLAFANGCFGALGALGAVSATFPAEAMLDTLGWRGLFLVLATVTFAVMATIWCFTPAGDPRYALTAFASATALRPSPA